MPAIPTTSEEWATYFRRNLESLLPIPWDEATPWNPLERTALGPSLQEFQLGETSDGRTLLRQATHHASRSGDSAYADAMVLFVREEQRHSGLLARFLERAGLPLHSSTWFDRVFRRIRRCSGLELALIALSTAEVLGTVYYRAVRGATRSLLLRRICQQLLRDECMHLRFHGQRLARMRTGRARWRIGLAARMQKILAAGAAIVLWLRHRRAFRAGNYTLARCWREWREEMRKFLQGADPRSCGTTPADAFTRSSGGRSAVAASIPPSPRRQTQAETGAR